MTDAEYAQHLIDVEAATGVDARRKKACDAINLTLGAKLLAGVTYMGKIIQTRPDAADLANITAMGARAGLVKLGIGTWPEHYSRGWICADNTRLAMPACDDGIALSQAVEDVVAPYMQHARDLKDAVGVSDSPETIDIESGWPS
jgi:hypothetical protein